MVWEKNETITLGSGGDNLDLDSLTALKFNQILIHSLSTGAKNHRMTTDNNNNTDYAWRRNANGATDNTQVSQAFIDQNVGLNQSSDCFGVFYGINIDGEEKLFIGFEVETASTGAASPPDRNEIVSKVDTTTNSGQYTDVDVNNTLAGDYLTDSNITALSTD